MFPFDVFKNKSSVPQPHEALPGRDQEMAVSEAHYVNGNPIKGPFPEHLEQIVIGLGCFWGAERVFWKMEGVYSTAVGYAAGHTPNPTYREVCTGKTGHNEVVLVVFDPEIVSRRKIIAKFFESHNPTEGMRQGNDVGTQYRSGIYYNSEEQRETAEAVKEVYQLELSKKGFSPITTEIKQATPFYYAEEAHQQYLAKNPGGYCGLGGVGLTCPVGVDA